MEPAPVLIGALPYRRLRCRPRSRLHGRASTRHGWNRNQTTHPECRSPARRRRRSTNPQGTALCAPSDTTHRPLPPQRHPPRARSPRRCAEGNHPQWATPPFLVKQVSGTPHARWRDNTQSGRASHHGIQPVAPRLEGSSSHCRSRSSARSRIVVPCCPARHPRPCRWRQTTAACCGNDRRFGAPRMRIAVLDLATGQQSANLNQLVDDRLVRIPLATFALAGCTCRQRTADQGGSDHRPSRCR